jgi:hypothetical protein
MQYTFLPQVEENDIKRKYRVRVTIVSLFFLSISFIIGAGALFPAYIHASLEEEIHLSDISALRQTDATSVLSAAEKDLSGSSVLMSDLTGSTAPELFSEAIAKVASIHGDVYIKGFSLARIASSTVSVSIDGTAPTRVSLLSFKSRLETLTHGKPVELPISELAQDANISFSITITE